MPHSSLFEELEQMTSLDAPSGFEEPVLAYCLERLAKLCDRTESDMRGNVYGYLEGTSPKAPKVAVITHADEIGLQVTRIDSAGYLGFTKIGGITDSVLPGSRVHLLTDRGKVLGVVGVRPGHILSANEVRSVPAIREMYLDVGVASESEAMELGIEPGTPAVLVSPLTRSSNSNRVFGKAVDNRAGIVGQLRVAELAARSRPACSLIFVVTVEEEVGLRGAEVAMRRIEPDVVLALDTVPAGGPPDVSPADLPWEIGKGPLIKVRETKGFLSHRPLRERFRKVARDQGIAVQTIVDTAGITDATSAQQASENIAALTLGLPRKYSHSAVEMLDLRDLEGLIELLSHGIESLTERETLRRL